MKKMMTMVLCAALAVMMLAGCAIQKVSAEPAPENAPAVVETEVTKEQKPETADTEQNGADDKDTEDTEDAEEIDPNYIPDAYSPTTGLEGTTEYKPVIVQIENELPARPQAGLQWADVVYESMIEGADTRFTCVFNDKLWEQDSPKKLQVGPVRSTRYYHQYIQGEWDGLYVHMGGSETPNSESYIWGKSSEHVKQRINAAGKRPSNASLIYRIDNGKRLEHTAYTELHADAEIYDYEPTVREGFTFYPMADYSALPEVKGVQLSFWRKPGFVEYTYDAASGKLLRSMDGKEFIAEETGKAVEVQNLIVQYTHVNDLPDEGGRKQVDLFGEDKADFIIGGRHISGTWKRADAANAPTQYFDSSGAEIVLRPGNTWIEIHPKDSEVLIDHADGSTYSWLENE